MFWIDRAVGSPRLVKPRCRYSALAAIALTLPLLIGYNLPPSATFFNQVLALLGWGAWLLIATLDSGHDLIEAARRSTQLLSALAVVAGAALTSLAMTGLAMPLALSATAVTSAAALAIWSGAGVAPAIRSHNLFQTLCISLLIAGSLSSAIGFVQVYAPTFADGEWIARSSAEGRAVGNLRQPNHLCTLLLWAFVAAVWLIQTHKLRAAPGLALTLTLTAALVLTGSRSAIVGTVILTLWGILDSRLPRHLRASLLLAPLVYAGLWIAASAWEPHGRHVFSGAGRYSVNGDISSSRFGIWANTLELIKAHPWTGVGFGEFNFAWTLTAFPDRPVAFFDHTHNLPLQFAVELGLPLAGVVLGLLGWALVRAARNCLRPASGSDPASPQRAAFVMVLLTLMHSMLEYPLWYAYFLLPAAFALGVCLGSPIDSPNSTAPAPPPKLQAWPIRASAVLLILGSAYSIYDYLSVVVIFAPPANPAPLTQRIADGQRSVFFSHHADYAAATTSEEPKIALAAAQRAAHYLLDTRLMMAWANALHATGDTERAKYVAARLKEFRNPQSEGYFAPCSDTAVAAPDKPYQCFPPQRKFTFKDFR